ncbi:enoyl-CoA hydratase/isomerase family protein [Gordonia neofelifaecis]|uniref:3-hydroxyisobutyryl-CoA hydrolase n=1 Tax=Gordonia neofelifaecis NRRL B-59395 TaxID=644548 RepID=F1YIM5_9ACTN|nr:enoyl-CoA hydratase/isomerase family protein [Gordonia neofelifaecis]EGD55333.1 3-hydroxyisobutyryl-CoA hydrolase [Gordonia neofelifaecis NRRL B-59395]
MTELPVLVSESSGVGRLVLNRPKAINALNDEMVDLMAAALRRWRDDDSVRAVVLSGAGERGLCAGGDIVSIHRDAKALVESGAGDEEAAACPSAVFWREEYQLNSEIAKFPKPYVALMDGIVMGGGVGVSAHANTRVVTDRTRLAMPETGIGFVPDVGGTHLLSQITDNIGVYLGLTAGSINGADAVALGIADHYIPAADLDAFVTAIEATSVDEALARFTQTPPPSELDAQRGWIREAFAADTVAGIIDRCAAVGTEAADKAAATLRAKSPTTLAVTLRALRNPLPTLDDSLHREYRVSLRCVRSHDMAEGIRAQVIDKDRNPGWDPAEIDAVTAADVDAFFAPLPDDLELTIVGD